MSYNTVGIIKNGVKQKLPVVMVAPKVDGPDYVEVVADGVKTYSALLDSLFSLIDVARITSKSKLFETDTYVNISYSVQMWTSSLLRVCMAYHSATKWVSQNLELKASDSTFLRFEDSTSTDYSSQVVNTGVVLRFYYDTATLDLTTRASNCVYDNSGSDLSATDAQGAIDEVDAKANMALGELLGEVTSDGVKTNSQLMDELFAQLDLTKLTKNSVLVDPYDFVFSLNHGGSELVYTSTRVGSSNIITEGRTVKASGSTVYIAITGAGSTTFNNNSSIAPASGLSLKIYS